MGSISLTARLQSLLGTTLKGCLSNKTALAMIFVFLRRREELASPQRLCLVAKGHSRGKVKRRIEIVRSRNSNRRRLIQPVTRFGDSSTVGRK